jgi:hypothetical protein
MSTMPRRRPAENTTPVRRVTAAAAVMVVAGVGLIGCAAIAPAGQADPSRTNGGQTDPAQPASTGFDLPQGGEAFALDPSGFTTVIDNPYLPLVPGTRSTFRETTVDGEELRAVIVVTDQSRKIANGVEARVVRDTVFRGSEVVEDTFDWFAQDADGNVWYLGEDTAEFENGAVTSTGGSFEAGVDGALPGIAMPAHPQPGLAYRQEYAAGEAEDNGEIVRLGEKATTPLDQFTDVVVTRDTITIEPDAVEYKFYAEGVGLVLSMDVSGGTGRSALIGVDQAPAGAGIGPLGQPE